MVTLVWVLSVKTHCLSYLAQRVTLGMAMVNPMLNLAIPNPNVKDSRWLTLEVCREFQRNKCTRTENECKFAHPPPHVEVQNGRVIACFDSIKVSWMLCDVLQWTRACSCGGVGGVEDERDPCTAGLRQPALVLMVYCNEFCTKLFCTLECWTKKKVVVCHSIYLILILVLSYRDTITRNHGPRVSTKTHMRNSVCVHTLWCPYSRHHILLEHSTLYWWAWVQVLPIISLWCNMIAPCVALC